MARGFRIADAYVAVTVDKDGLRQSVRDIPGDVGPDADRAGADLGERVTKGLQAKLEALSGKLTRVREAQKRAVDAEKLAEVKLNEVRENAKAKASAILAAEQKLEAARRKVAAANREVESTTRRRAEVENELAHAIRGAAEAAGPEADRAGRDTGDKLALGMRLAIIRNSPLIAAAIGGVLVAGAPVVSAGAVGLFAGIGIAAQAQSTKVRSAWSDTWDGIKEDAFDSSSALQPVLIGLADRVGDAFHRMAPSLREAFEAAAPQVDVFADGILGLAQEALPGLVRAVERGMPVTKGLADLLESTGRGLTGFFDNISEHSPAAGKAFTLLGQALEEILPTLGVLIGQGAELATIILPPLVTVLRAVSGVVDDLGPALPALVTGFTALKIAQSAAGWVGGLQTKLKSLPGSIGPIGFALAGATAAFQAQQAQIEEWADAIRDGGQAAQTARSDIAAVEAQAGVLSSGFAGGITSVLGYGQALHNASEASDAVERSLRDQWRAMDPLSQAQSKVAEWTATLSERLNDESASSEDVEAAQRRLAYWTGETERQQSMLESAVDGVTQALIEQADQAMAAIDSGFAYRHAVDQLEDAQKALNEAVRDHGRGSEEAQRAQLDLEEQTYRTAAAYAQQQADLSGLSEDSAEYKRIIQTELLAELYRLRDAAGPQMAAAIQQQINSLEQGGISMQEVGRYADDATSRLRNLGAQRPQPVAFLNNVPFFSAAAATQNRMNAINALRASPLAFLYANTYNAERALNNAARNRVSYVTQYVRQVLSSIPLFHADGGFVGRSSGGFVKGPGGPTEDRVGPFPSPSGNVFLSDDEFVVKASAVDRLERQFGKAIMPLINEGRLPVRAPAPPQDALVGAPAVSSAASSSAGAGTIVPTSAPDAGSGGGGGRTVHIENLNLTIPGPVDITDRRALRRTGEAIRDVLIELDREQS